MFKKGSHVYNSQKMEGITLEEVEERLNGKT